jgi:hypothetical protein
MEPDSRLTCAELLEHKYFDGFRERFEPELQALMSKNQDQHQTKSKKQKVSQSFTVLLRQKYGSNRVHVCDCVPIAL